MDRQGGTLGSRRQLTLLGSFVPPSLPLPLLCPLPSRRPGHGSDVTRRRWGGLPPAPGSSSLDTVHTPTRAALSELLHERVAAEPSPRPARATELPGDPAVRATPLMAPGTVDCFLALSFCLF